MPFVRKTWSQIRAFLEQLPRDTKFLIVALVVILGLAGTLLVLWAGEAEWAPVPGVSLDGQTDAARQLERQGIPVRVVGGRLSVPEGREIEATALLAQSDLLSGNTFAAFDELIEQQSPWLSNRQNDQRFSVARMKIASQIISAFGGVQTAKVMIAEPKKQGYGDTHERPKASVTVAMEGNRRMSRQLAETIASFLGNVLAEMRPQDVTVVDAIHGRRYVGTAPGDYDPSEKDGRDRELERALKRKIELALDYVIPQANVAVNVVTDSLVRKNQQSWEYGKTQPLKRQHERTEESKSTDDAGAPGARPNTGMSIAGSSGTSIEEKISDSDTEFQNNNLTTEYSAVYAGGSVTEKRVTIGVPRPHFVALYMLQNGAGDGNSEPPDAAALQPVVEAELALIKSKIENLVDASDSKGVVHVDMIPDPAALVKLQQAGVATGGLTWVLTQDWAKPAGLGMLVLLSMGVMFFMVRKANQHPRVPSAEELAGVPPPLMAGDDDDLVGEAMADEAAMAGVEIDEDEIRSRRIAEQIGEMIKANPAEAASLVGKWVGPGV